METVFKVPTPKNEPVNDFAPGSEPRTRLKQALADMSGQVVEIPCIVSGKPVHTGRLVPVVMPHKHGHVLANFHAAGASEVQSALEACQASRPMWQNMAPQDRLSIFLKAAELVAGRHRAWINAATMLGQSKTCHQAEIDAVCETVDFWRFNPSFAMQLYADQPQSAPGTWNTMQYRPLEGSVLAITPFNFTAIGANLPTAPAMMGNTVIWKPAESQTLSAYLTYKILEEAGLPAGVINFLPGFGNEIAPIVTNDASFAGLHFTGSTSVFRQLYKNVAQNLDLYRSFPRMVGETGGKDFIVAHPSADPEALVAAIVRGAFEYQGQKCSAASRIYLPRGLWQTIRRTLIDTVASLKVGDVADFSCFMGAVIRQDAFIRLSNLFDAARSDPHVTILTGGTVDGNTGWFVQPTLLITDDSNSRFLKEEFFGPVATIFLYEDHAFEDVLGLIDATSTYALTGAVFSQDRQAVAVATQRLEHSAGNFYVNDKPTGAVVGQQPFGGARGSGTNDKAGSIHNLLRWVSPRVIKETFDPPRGFRYSFMSEP
jgi:1-pyrroline-5-carboxylate dehydrogenase